MARELKTVAKYGTPEEAHLLRNRLEEAGIRVFLEGESMAAWAWHFANALGGVKVLVSEEQYPAAMAVLAGRRPEETGDPAAPTEAPRDEDRPSWTWTCPNCRTEIDAAMDICWACGTAADGTKAPKTEDEAAAAEEDRQERRVPPDIAFLTVLFPPTLAYFLFTKLCRLVAPLVPDATHHEPAAPAEAGPAWAIRAGEDWRPAPEPLTLSRRQPGPESDAALDAILERALRAALIGILMLPPLLMTLYSTWLLVKYWSRRRGVRRRGDWRAVAALCINVVMAVLAGVLVSLALASALGTIWHKPAGIGPPSPSDFGP